jgi:hypothetical protein
MVFLAIYPEKPRPLREYNTIKNLCVFRRGCRVFVLGFFGLGWLMQLVCGGWVAAAVSSFFVAV